ncbi:MAG TPA: DUF5615 family PIN-like protein [Candidatus Binatia bacterium]|nr:DUF5615 family PIN-like protein [Candidatus Binatia bacterium]
MRIKLDENLPLRLAIRLKSFGHDVHTVYDEHLVGHADNDVWETAQKESRFLITQDLDFSDCVASRLVLITASYSYDSTRQAGEI